MPIPDDHLNCDDPGLIEGRCTDCGKVIYSRTPAARCHRSGSWYRSTWEGRESLTKRIARAKSDRPNRAI